MSQTIAFHCQCNNKFKNCNKTRTKGQNLHQAGGRAARRADYRLVQKTANQAHVHAACCVLRDAWHAMQASSNNTKSAVGLNVWMAFAICAR
jgi:hypothetical protein